MAPVWLVAVTSDRGPRFGHDAYERVEQLQIGKRRTLFFAPRP